MESFRPSTNYNGTGNPGCKTLEENITSIPYKTTPTTPAIIGDWQDEMCGYLKNHQYFPHLTAVSYAGEHIKGIKDGDLSYLSDNVDVATWNFYLDGVNINERLTNNYKKLHGDMQIATDTTLVDIDKPIMISELGNGSVQTCNRDIEFYKDAWTSCFTGNASMGMNWQYDNRIELAATFATIKGFINGINFDGGTDGPWLPQYHERDNKASSMYLLKSQEKKKRAIGVIVNNTVNYWTRGTSLPCVGSAGDALEPAENAYLSANQVISDANNPYVLHDMGRLKWYIIDYYNALADSLIFTDFSKTNWNKELILEHPVLWGDTTQYLIAFKVYRVGEPNFITANDTPQQQPMRKLLAQALQESENRKIKEKKVQNKEVIETKLEEESALIQLAPNPTNNKCTVTFSGDLTRANVKIISPNATLIAQQTLNSNTFIVDLTKQPAGIYLVIINTGTIIYTKKISKQ